MKSSGAKLAPSRTRPARRTGKAAGHDEKEAALKLARARNARRWKAWKANRRRVEMRIHPRTRQEWADCLELAQICMLAALERVDDPKERKRIRKQATVDRVAAAAFRNLRRRLLRQCRRMGLDRKATDAAMAAKRGTAWMPKDTVPAPATGKGSRPMPDLDAARKVDGWKGPAW